MNIETDPLAPPAYGWHHMPSGDWAYYLDGQQAGIVCFNQEGGRWVWYSVSSAKSHGPEVGKLSECKRRVEALWRQS